MKIPVYTNAKQGGIIYVKNESGETIGRVERTGMRKFKGVYTKGGEEKNCCLRRTMELLKYCSCS